MKATLKKPKEKKVKNWNLNHKISIRDLNLYYGSKKALKNITFDIPKNQVTAFIGPSGCGKSTLLRCLNRMNDLIDNISISGSICIDGNIEVLNSKLDVTSLRRRIGMVFQKPNPFPKSIRKNITYGLKLIGKPSKEELENKIEESLKRVGLWNEVKDRLDDSAMVLSGGQSQRLCIARTIAIEPDVILMDEPTSALDPASTQKIEELLIDLKKKYTVIIVTHNMQQAARVSEVTAFFYLGELIEIDSANKIFTNPKKEMTENYITGRFG